jgi:hypothetical protein
MIAKKIIRTIAITELAIGASTILGLVVSTIFFSSKKSPNVFMFVLMSATASSLIGIGLLRHKHWARMVLVFFSGYIVLTKILIFADLLHFNGEIITLIPASLKNYISIAYHCFVVLFFTRRTTKTHFAAK